MSVAPALLALIVTGAWGQPQQPQPAPQTPAPVSERQKERITKQERMIACNRQGRDAGLRGARRQDFVRDCLKGDNAAVGGGQQK
jgi:hypothetical protein